MKTPKANREPGQTRRAFLRRSTVAAAGIAGAASLADWRPVYAGDGSPAVVLVPDSEDPNVPLVPVQWAIGQLQAALTARGLQSAIRPTLAGIPAGSFGIVAGTDASPLARRILQNSGVASSEKPSRPEGVRLVRGNLEGRRFLLAGGSDARGLVYALLELADRVAFAFKPMADLKSIERVIQYPANAVRSVARLFASDVEDKPWFYDRSFWASYLTELATQRFNRFSLMLGLGYDFTTDIHDAYFHFAYPFLVAIPGNSVRAVPLPDQEREKNLAMLQFISEETARRGLHFQLGLWTHAYQWVDSPHANYVIEGLSAETHAAYCRGALETLLHACPAISGVTLRIHGESGIAEGSYDFWKTVFEGVARCGRPVEIDLHAKGIDDAMIDLALATRMPVKVSPKFWAEHMGLGYMQGAIRPLEMPPREENDKGFFAKSSGSRRFLRYGYGDLLREDRRYGVLHRIWPGTQRLLLWGSPELAADYGRAASFCGSVGVELCEPLSFKGRKGSGLPGGRDGYQDGWLRPHGGDFEKYRYTYRVWGRHFYDPDCDQEETRRGLRQAFGRSALSIETALQQSSRILPLITTAHCPSAANNNYWPEMYTNMAIVDPKRPHPYGDTLSPKRFGTVSPLDPEFFSMVDDFADSLLQGSPGPKYCPIWVAATLQAAADASGKALGAATRQIHDPQSAEFRRLAADVQIQIGLGAFFSWKFQSAVLFAIYSRTSYAPALEQAVVAYRRARDAWAKMAETAKPIYRRDVTFGPGEYQRGHWSDRLPAIDADIADMASLLQKTTADKVAASRNNSEVAVKAVEFVLRSAPMSNPPLGPGFHVPPPSFRRGEPLALEAVVGEKRSVRLKSLHLRFRRVNQGDTWQVKVMEPQGGKYSATIAATYTNSPFPLQYHFECHAQSGTAWLFPGLSPGWKGQPYFYLQQS